jgi:hypothetical protein|tara:strand:- start:901 stop:2082 length:1182 start_codon:yes stop_codon:yes gene_type:complete
MAAQTNHTGNVVTFMPKKCPKGHICTVQAKKCSTCGAACVSMSKSAVKARLRRQKRRVGKTVKLIAGKRKRGAQSKAVPAKKQTKASKDLARINLVKGANARVGKRTVTIVSTAGKNIHFRYADDGSLGTRKSAKDVRAMCVFFTNEHGNDVEMDSATSWTILEAYANRKADVAYSAGSQSYKLVINGTHKGAQTNVNTDVTRPVFLRKIKTVPKVAPLFSIQPTPLSTVPADLQSIIRKQRFLSQCEIYDLQPWLRGDQIVTLQQQIQKEHGNPSDLTWAWHGTNIAGAQSIAVTGFQDAGTANAKCYGVGPYLSTDPTYSLGYCVPDAHKRHVLFACHTLLGNRESTGSNVRMLSSHTVRSGGQSSGHLIMKPWVYAHTDINIAYAIVFKK